MALDHRLARLHDVVKVLARQGPPEEMLPETVEVEAEGNGARVPVIETTVGRLIFNQCFPDAEEFVNRPLLKTDVARLVDSCVHRYDRAEVEQILDNLKNVGFHYATRAGVTLGIEDVTTPQDKVKILDGHELRASKIEGQYRKGIITDDERRQELIRPGRRRPTRSRTRICPVRQDEPHLHDGQLKACGNIMQIRQIAGMRGLVANPKGEIIPCPIKSNFREGLSVLEYFISTHGARKGLADTALRTADSGTDPATRGRRAGADRPRGGLRHRPFLAGSRLLRDPDGVAPRTSTWTRRCTGESCRGREGRAQEGRLARRHRRRRDRAGARRGRRGRVGPRALGHDLRGRVRRVPALLWLVARDGPARRHRRVGGHRRGAVDRRAGDTAHDADVPHRRCRRRGHHARPAARGGAVRGAKPKGEAQITELPGTVTIEDDEEKKVRRITVTPRTASRSSTRSRSASGCSSATATRSRWASSSPRGR